MKHVSSLTVGAIGFDSMLTTLLFIFLNVNTVVKEVPEYSNLLNIHVIYKNISFISDILEDFENASPYFCTFLANHIYD